MDKGTELRAARVQKIAETANAIGVIAAGSISIEPNKRGAAKPIDIARNELALASFLFPENERLRGIAKEEWERPAVSFVTYVSISSVVFALSSGITAHFYSMTYGQMGVDRLIFLVSISIFASCLGILGAAFQILAGMLFKSPDGGAGTIVSARIVRLRLLWGFVAGWLFAFIFSRWPLENFFLFSAGSNDGAGSVSMFAGVLLPVVAGYSGAFVTTLLSKAESLVPKI